MLVSSAVGLPNNAVPGLCLHVQDLPQTIDALSSGGVYALVVDTPPSRFPLLAGSLSGALDHGLITNLLLATPPQPWLERLEQLGLRDTEQAVETGRLQVFQQQTDFTKKIFRHGTPAFVQELEHFGLPRDSLLVVDQADDLLSLHDMSLASGQAEVLCHWARAQNITILLVFTRVAAVSGAAACLNGLMDSLRGIARLGGQPTGLSLRFEYWQSPSGTVAGKNFQLRILETGRYQVQPEAAALGGAANAAQVQAGVETQGESKNYYYLDNHLETLSRMVPGQWLCCESVMAIFREALGTPTPTVLLCFKPGMALRELAESVHTLRLSLGRRARLVVVEKDASLRYANEVLLLRLGANLILHRDMTEARMLLMLESLQGQVFSRDLAIDFEKALLNVTTPSHSGYVHPGSFCNEVQQVVERLNQLNVPSSLVTASLKSPDDALALLRAVNITRQGDLFTTDGRQCYFFFCGCPEESVATVWSKAIGPAQREALGEPAVLSVNASILQATRQLAQAVQGYHFPSDLPEHMGVRTPAPEPQATVPAQQPMPEPVDHDAARAASLQPASWQDQPAPAAAPEPDPWSRLVDERRYVSGSDMSAADLSVSSYMPQAQAQQAHLAQAHPMHHAWPVPQAPQRFAEPNTAALLEKILKVQPLHQPPH